MLFVFPCPKACLNGLPEFQSFQFLPQSLGNNLTLLSPGNICLSFSIRSSGKRKFACLVAVPINTSSYYYRIVYRKYSIIAICSKLNNERYHHFYWQFYILPECWKNRIKCPMDTDTGPQCMSADTCACVVSNSFVALPWAKPCSFRSL
jgi:hypothetical protein